MDMYMGPVDPDFAALPLSDPRCRNESCAAYLNAENESQAAVSWLHQFEYGHWVTYYYVIILGILMLIHIARTWRDWRARGDVSRSFPLYQKAAAACRFLSYRRVTSKSLNMLGLPSGGMLAFLLMTVVFLVILMFAVKPFYREHMGYGSPPLAIRTGLMSFACTPILIALAGKANVITLLSGFSHEKLNVVHQWVAWMSFGLALVHAIPFLLQSYWDGPFYSVSGTENVKIQFYAYGTGGGSEYSGVPPLAILFGLCIFSLPYIRNRFYESFYFTHVLMGITYLGLLFWHAMNIEDSWAYLWATLALWLTSYLARTFYYTRPMNIRGQWLSGAPTVMQQLPGNMTRIELIGPPSFSYTPAQHCFLRFPSISLLDNHPFTLISSPGSIEDGVVEKESNSPTTLSFLVRTQTGFTRRLAQKCTSQPGNLAYAWIDGPYGGINRPAERLYDTMILIAGGSGISACLPWLLHAMHKRRTSPESQLRAKRIVLIWVMREDEHFAWAADDLKDVSASEPYLAGLQIELKFYVTGSADSSVAPITQQGMQKQVKATETESTESSYADEMARVGEYSQGRPEIFSLVGDILGKDKNLVFGCGPQMLRNDISNACAALQKRVLRGEMQELVMHLEAFGW